MVNGADEMDAVNVDISDEFSFSLVSLSEWLPELVIGVVC